jgi:hypothetical protein
VWHVLFAALVFQRQREITGRPVQPRTQTGITRMTVATVIRGRV